MTRLFRERFLSISVAAVAVASCSGGGGGTSLPLTCNLAGASGASVPIAAGTGLALDTSLDYSASTVDAWSTSGSVVDHPSIALASGDAALRKIGDGAVVLNRGAAGSLLFVDGTLAPAGQVSLGSCGPHDVELLDDCRVLVTCFERPTMAIVSLDTGAVTDGPDLAAFADADGIPEMDQLGRVGDRIYVSLELLDRNDPMWAPASHGLVVALDARTLQVVDLDAATPGVQGLEVCMNPYTDLALGPDGRLYLGCSGVYGVADTSAVVAIDDAHGTVATIADGPSLAGQLSDLHLDAAGVPYVVTSYPYTEAFVMPDEMRLGRLVPGGLEVLYSTPGSTLGNFGVGPDGRVYVANRCTGEPGGCPAASAGIWAVEPATGAVSGPIVTTVPPLDIETF